MNPRENTMFWEIRITGIERKPPFLSMEVCGGGSVRVRFIEFSQGFSRQCALLGKQPVHPYTTRVRQTIESW